MSTLKDQYELLKENRPSVISHSILMFIYRYLGLILAVAAIVFGISLLINAAIGNGFMSVVTGTTGSIPEEITTRITIFVALVSITIGILFFMISTLAKRLLKRNRYIIELEEIIDESVDSFAAQPV